MLTDLSTHSPVWLPSQRSLKDSLHTKKQPAGVRKENERDDIISRVLLFCLLLYFTYGLYSFLTLETFWCKTDTREVGRVSQFEA